MKHRKDIYIEILSLTNGLVILFLFSHRLVFLYASVAIALLSVFIPKFALLLSAGLRKILQVLGIISNYVILGFVYLLILTPLALLYRLFGKKKNESQKYSDSYFSLKDHTYSPEDFKNQW